MALLTGVSRAGPLAEALRHDRQVRIYETFVVLGIAAVFSLPLPKMRESGYGGGVVHSVPVEPVTGDFIDWGEATHFRVLGLSDEVSAASPDGLVVEYSLDGAAVEGLLLDTALVADTLNDSGWVAVQGIAGRLRLTNGATLQGSLELTMDLAQIDLHEVLP